MVHMCPRCELRFTTAAELADHLEVDHGAGPLAHVVHERLHYEGKARPGRDRRGRRYLVVANQTLHGDELLGHVRRLAGERSGPAPASFYLLVPAAALENELGVAGYRLREMVEKLHADGIDAEGEVGPHDPYRAVGDVVERESFDEIIVSTLPSGFSKWLEADLSQRLKRRFGLPVTTVTQSG